MSSAVSIAPFAYIPQSLAIAIARLFTPPVFVIFYVARLANLLIASSLIFLAMEISRSGRWLFAFVALLPMTSYLLSSTGPDGIIIGSAFLFLALILRIRENAIAISRTDVLALGLLAFLIGSERIHYVPLVGALVLLPPAAFTVRWKRSTVFTLIGAVTMIGVSIFVLLARSDLTAAAPEAHISPFLQLRTMLTAPRHAFASLGWLVSIGGTVQLREFTGVLGWLDTPLPLWANGLSGVLLTGIAPFAAAGTLRLRSSERLTLAASWLSSAAVIFVAAYVLWNPVGANYVLGIQGRYFLPLVPLLMMSVTWRNGVAWKQHAIQAGLVLAMIPLGAAIVALLQRYYPA